MSASNITAAINANGDAVVAWEQGTKVVAVTRQGLSGAFTNTTTPDTIDTLGDSPVAAIDGAGNAIVAMHHNGVFPGDFGEPPPGGRLHVEPPATLAPGGGDASPRRMSRRTPTARWSSRSSTRYGGNRIASVRHRHRRRRLGLAHRQGAVDGYRLTRPPGDRRRRTARRSSAGRHPRRCRPHSVPPAAASPPPDPCHRSRLASPPDDFALGGSARGDAVVALEHVRHAIHAERRTRRCAPGRRRRLRRAKDRVQTRTSTAASRRSRSTSRAMPCSRTPRADPAAGRRHRRLRRVRAAGNGDRAVEGPGEIAGHIPRLRHRRVLSVHDEMVLRRRWVGHRLSGDAHIHPDRAVHRQADRHRHRRERDLEVDHGHDQCQAAASVCRAEAEGQDARSGEDGLEQGSLPARHGAQAQGAQAPQAPQTRRDEVLARGAFLAPERDQGRPDARPRPQAEAQAKHKKH